MARKPTKNDETQKSGVYQHKNQTIQRPPIGVQEDFPDRRAPKKYRYDSSLAPELNWDENGEREFAEWLLALIEKATKEGEAAAFKTVQTWKGTGERFGSVTECVTRLKSLTQPFLNWSGKAERQQIYVPTIPLFVHERHSTQAILHTLSGYKAVGTNLELFGDPQLDVADELNAYEHQGPWSNRLVLGDSLQVMNSLLEYEGLGGQVQMVYMDPPYGVNYGSNFQPFVRNRNVGAANKDEELIREPEMVKAYRDTWELGLHSYLTYTRDRMLLAKELLAESGSIFLQISDKNLHHVKEVMDEVFGESNFIALIPFRKKTMPFGTTYIEQMADFLIWYGKSKGLTQYSALYKKVSVEGEFHHCWYELPDGSRHRMTTQQVDNHALLPKGARIYRLKSLEPSGVMDSGKYDFEFEGRLYKHPKNGYATPPDGMKRLVEAKRIQPEGNRLTFILYADETMYSRITAPWMDTVGADDKAYVVQTNTEVVKRCMLMTTRPGDLVFDPTCGSGTTAYVAEKWGRRWITSDTSRVPLALARQRLLTATFPWYELKEPKNGPAGGFVYERKQNRRGEEDGGLLPRITLKSIANNEDPEMTTLVDKPEENNKITRVCGPFTVEATVQSAQSIYSETASTEDVSTVYENPRRYLDRMIEVLRQSHTLRLPGNKSLELANVRALSAENHEFLHAEAVENNGSSKRIAVVFGPEDGAINSEIVFEAAREAYYLKFDALYFFGFAIQAKARELIDDRKKLRLPCFYINVTPDVVMSDLLKTSKSSEIFSVTGLPDVRVGKTGKKSASGDALYQAELLGLDVFRPHDLETESIAAENLPCWMLDTDYNGMVFMARQVFFPKTSAWDNLQKSLKGRFGDSVWEHLAGTVSEPFEAGEHRRIAVKVIDERGNELLVVQDLQGAS